MKVSVAMITYNHERFIAQAIDSVLMQKVNFDFELVVGEDCSTDKTREIVLKYQQQYPNKIRLLLPIGNLGANKNLAQTLAACRGEYIATLEGDDYWTWFNKLQAQVDFLDHNADFSMCFTEGVHICDDGKVPPKINPYDKDTYFLHDVLREFCPPLVSLMLRRKLIIDLPDWFASLYTGDWPLTLLAMFKMPEGKIKRLNNKAFVHRYHSGGIWSPLSTLQKTRKSYQVMKKVIRISPDHYKNELQLNLLRYRFYLAYLYYELGRKKMAQLYYAKLKQSTRQRFSRSMMHDRAKSKERMMNYTILYAPWVFKTYKSLKGVVSRSSLINTR